VLHQVLELLRHPEYEVSCTRLVDLVFLDNLLQQGHINLFTEA